MGMPERTRQACQQCDANCCRTFSLAYTKAAMRQRLLEGKCGSMDSAHACLWAVLWYRRIRRPKGGSKKHGGAGRAYWYTCTLLDPETNRCKHYSIRPPMCRNFLCKRAMEETDSGTVEGQ